MTDLSEDRPIRRARHIEHMKQLEKERQTNSKRTALIITKVSKPSISTTRY